MEQSLSGDSNRKSQNRSRVSIARQAAYACLKQIRCRNAFADDVIGKIIDGSDMDLRDRAFATKLVLGVVSTQGILDETLNMCMGSPKDVRPDLRDALRISAYELIYLKKDPYACVDQGVELARFVAPRASRLANAVLRKLSSLIPDFPFGDPSSDIKAYCRLHGFPLWLTEKAYRALGPELAHSFISASNEPAPVFISIIPINQTRSEILASLSRHSIEIEPVSIGGMAIDDCFRLLNPRDIANDAMIDLIGNGCLIVSDAAAQLIAQIAVNALKSAIGGPKGLELSCLELCAGRGTKTILLQRDSISAFGGQFARYIAVDNIDFKVRLLEDRAQKYGISVDESICADILDLGFGEGDLFDLVFLDSPCSGLGTLRRHPEIRWRITDDLIKGFSKKDIRLLAHSAQFIKPGGLLVYSTCTITPDENSHVVKSFLNSKAGSDFEHILIDGKPMFATHLMPGGSDAHFCAILRRLE